jgi:hypothetical protein
LAFVVSVFSLFFLIRNNRKTFRLTEQHNKKSVEPVFSINYSEELDRDIVEFGGIQVPRSSYIVKLELKNCGFGPAIIKSYALRIDNRDFEEIFSIYKQFIGQPKYVENKSYRRTFENDVIASNETKPIFIVCFTNSDSFKEFCELLKRIRLIIEFETIYEEKRNYDVAIVK